MAKTNWTSEDFVLPSDMNSIGSEINGIKTDFIKKSTNIPDGSDLNSYMTEGGYICPTNAGAASLLNSPTEEAFHLTVQPHAGVLQTLTTFQPGNIQTYQRNYYFGWGPWNRLPTSEDVGEAEEDANAALAAVANIEEVLIPNLNSSIAANYMPKYRPSNLIGNSNAEMWGAFGWKNANLTVPIKGVVGNGVSGSWFEFTGAPNNGAGPSLVYEADLALGNGAVFTLGAEFYNPAATPIRVEVYGMNTGNVAAVLTASIGAQYQRKNVTFTTSSSFEGSGMYKIRIAVSALGTETGVRQVRKISLVTGAVDVWNQDGNPGLLRVAHEKMMLWGAL